MALRHQRPTPGSAATPGLRQGGHGLSAAEVEHLLKRQGGVCLICGRDRRGMPWAIDHDHALAAMHPHPDNVGCKLCVRGILCQTCNTGLGNFQDDPRLLRVAAAYIELAREHLRG